MHARLTRLAPLALLLLFALPVFPAHAQRLTEKDVPWKAKAEILRRGDMVEHVDGYQSLGQLAFVDAIAPPADDAHKFYICVVTKRGCGGCEQLRADFDAHDVLKAWVNVKDHRASWAHYQVFQIEDASQAKRWEHKRPKVFPCVYIQPPFDGSFGNPKSLVFWQEGYSGPEELAKSMQAAVKKYCETVGPVRAAWKASHAGRFADANRGGFEQGFEQAGGKYDPPVPAPPRLEPPSVGPSIPPSLGASPEELRAALPDAPAEFLLGLVARRVTLRDALEEWRSERDRRAAEEAKKKAEEQAAEKEAQRDRLLARLIDRVDGKTPADESTPVVQEEASLTSLVTSAGGLLAIVVMGGGTLFTFVALAGLLIKAALTVRAKRVAAGATKFLIPPELAERLDKIDDLLIKLGTPK